MNKKKQLARHAVNQRVCGPPCLVSVSMIPASGGGKWPQSDLLHGHCVSWMVSQITKWNMTMISFSSNTLNNTPFYNTKECLWAWGTRRSLQHDCVDEIPINTVSLLLSVWIKIPGEHFNSKFSLDCSQLVVLPSTLRSASKYLVGPN